ncbi:MAG: hypothetical protein HY820_25700 [Acidobacteria bacterium]|nr:hypothetical protein [Acidobacteriota bacterium]
MKNRKLICVAVTVAPVLLYAYASGPDPRKTGAPGDGLCSESGCHVGTANSGGGRVEIVFPSGLTYSPGVRQRLQVRITDATARVYGFQATARLASNLSAGQAGDFTTADTSTQILCEDGQLKPAAGCRAGANVQFIEHTRAASTGNFSFDWTPPATNAGNVRLYVAANAANGNGLADSNDKIYTANYTLAPATTTTPPPTGISSALSQIADGTGWKTTIVLSNLDTVPAPYTLRFWKGDGTAQTFPLGANGAAVQGITGTIPVNGSQTLETPSTATTLSQGWGELISEKAIGGTAIFRQRAQGRQDSEGSVSLTTPTAKKVLLPFDNTQGFVTSLALVNPDAAKTATIAATFFDEAGNQIAADSLSLAPHGQLPFAMPDRFGATAGRRGVAQFSSAEINLTGLGLRFSPAGAFTSVAFLTPPASGVPGEALISQLVRHNNWTTTMILVNSDEAPAAYTIRFRNTDGTTMALPLRDEGTVTEVTGVIPANGARFLETDSQTAAALTHGWAELVTSNGISATTLIGQRFAGAESDYSVPFRRAGVR